MSLLLGKLSFIYLFLSLFTIFFGFSYRPIRIRRNHLVFNFKMTSISPLQHLHLLITGGHQHAHCSIIRYKGSRTPRLAKFFFWNDNQKCERSPWIVTTQGCGISCVQEETNVRVNAVESWGSGGWMCGWWIWVLMRSNFFCELTYSIFKGLPRSFRPSFGDSDNNIIIIIILDILQWQNDMRNLWKHRDMISKTSHHEDFLFWPKHSLFERGNPKNYFLKSISLSFEFYCGRMSFKHQL